MSHNDPQLDLLDALLMRVLDGEADDAEKARLLELADADARLAEQVELRNRLRSALGEPEPIEIVGEVLAALAIDDGWDATASLLRDELLAEDSLDLVDAVMSDVEPMLDQLPAEARLSAMMDGELSSDERLELGAWLAQNPDAVAQMTEWAQLGHDLRAELGDVGVDVWPAVSAEIGLPSPDHVEGWDAVAPLLREAVLADAELPARDEGALTAAIMNALPRPTPAPEPVMDLEPEPTEETTPWRQFLTSPSLPFFAAVLVAVILIGRVVSQGEAPVEAPTADRVALVTPETTPPVEDTGAVEVVAAFDGAEVEELEYDDSVLVQVIQMDDAPMFLMIDEGDEGAAL